MKNESWVSCASSQMAHLMMTKWRVDHERITTHVTYSSRNGNFIAPYAMIGLRVFCASMTIIIIS